MEPGPWLTETLAAVPGTVLPRWLRAAVPFVVGLALTGWLVGAALGLSWLPATLTPQSFQERSRLFAHDAVRFAGQDGMPARALVCHFLTSNVYVYHNGPTRKTYMDARLEVPTLATFQKYRAIEAVLTDGKPGWAEALAELGNPLLILVHNDSIAAESVVAAHPGWRLIYFDAQAAVFLPAGDRELEARFPSHDFGTRHFGSVGEPSVPQAPWAPQEEAIALAKFGTGLRSPDLVWTVRVPALLSALDRAALARQQGPSAGVAWATASACWGLSTSEGAPPPRPGAPWDPPTGLRSAQHSYGLRVALTYSPTDMRLLFDSYRWFSARGMYDCLPALGRKLLANPLLPPETADAIRKQVELAERVPKMPFPADGNYPGHVLRLLKDGRREEAVQLVEVLGESVWSGWPWPCLDAVAGCYFQLGYPDKARLVWQRARTVPSEGTRSVRIAATYWTERDLETAVRTYRDVQAVEPGLPEVCWSLAWLYAEMGDAARAIDAIDRAPAGLPVATKHELDRLRALLSRYDKRPATTRP